MALGASLAGEENTEREVLGEMMSADMVQAVYETLHDRPDELFAFAHKQSEGQMDCKTLIKTLRRLRTPEKVYLDAMALLGAAAQNKAEWDEKALLRLERILKMDDCRAAAELSARVELMIVIGGRNSGNTRRLYEICKARCEATHHIESDVEIDPSWLDGVERIGITAGASTPQEHIDAVRDRVRELAGGVA